MSKIGIISLDSVAFSLVNVGTGAVVSWLLSHYLLPFIFDTGKDIGRATRITIIYTVAALIRNILIFEVFNA